MNIVLATPLYPPDTAASARYVKELAQRLSGQHVVTILTYGALPEEVAGVRIIAVSKQQPLAFRLIAFTLALGRAVRTADLVVAENGASVEFPAGIIERLSRKPFFLHISDAGAHEHAKQSRVFGAIEGFMRSHARSVIDDMPAPRPEILPFSPDSAGALEAYEKSWHDHFNVLAPLFLYA